MSKEKKIELNKKRLVAAVNIIGVCTTIDMLFPGIGDDGRETILKLLELTMRGVCNTDKYDTIKQVKLSRFNKKSLMVCTYYALHLSGIAKALMGDSKFFGAVKALENVANSINEVVGFYQKNYTSNKEDGKDGENNN